MKRHREKIFRILLISWLLLLVLWFFGHHIGLPGGLISFLPYIVYGVGSLTSILMARPFSEYPLCGHTPGKWTRGRLLSTIREKK